MTAQLIDGNALSRQLRTEVAQRTAAPSKARGITPGLAVVPGRVTNLASQVVYAQQRSKPAKTVGFATRCWKIRRQHDRGRSRNAGA